MTFARLRVSIATANRLKSLKARTGLTPNVLCRLALCYSLADVHPIEPSAFDSNGTEFNRPTLLGDHDELYLALVRQRLVDERSDLPMEEALGGHINRGVALLSPRLKSIADVTELLPKRSER